MARKKATDISVFDALGENLVAYFTTLTFQITNADEDGKGAIDRWDDPNPVNSNWSLESDAFVPVTAAFMAIAVSSDPTGSAHWTVDGIAWSGTVLLSTANHTGNRNALQTQRISLKGKGAPLYV